MATEIWVNIGSGNGLLPDGTKPLPEPKLTDHWWSPLSSDIHIRTISQEMHQPSITKICLKITCLKFHENFPGANELMDNLALFTWGEVSTSHPWHKQRLLPTLKCTGAVRGEDQLISKHKGPVTLPKIRVNAWITHKIWLCVLVRR